MWRRTLDVLFWLAISLYFGGMVVLGAIVAPAVFDTAKQAHLSMPGIATPPLDMEPQVGGEIFGVILNRFGYVEAVCLALMLVALVGGIIGQRLVRRSTWVLLALWLLVAGLATYDAASLRPQVFVVRQQVRDQARAHAADVPGASWPARAEFDALHRRSETVGQIRVYALLGMILNAAWRSPRRAAERGSPHDAMWKSRRG